MDSQLRSRFTRLRSRGLLALRVSHMLRAYRTTGQRCSCLRRREDAIAAGGQGTTGAWPQCSERLYFLLITNPFTFKVTVNLCQMYMFSITVYQIRHGTSQVWVGPVGEAEAEFAKAQKELVAAAEAR